MVKGHVDQACNSQSSTKTLSPSPSFDPCPTNTNYNNYPSSPTPNNHSHYCYTTIMEPTGQVYINHQTGPFITPLSNGKNYLLTLYNYESNSILAKPLKNHTGVSILDSYQILNVKIYAARLSPRRLPRLDNKCSKPLKQFPHKGNVNFQLSPPGIHRSNAAKHAIQPFQNHFIDGRCSVDSNSPLHLW
jgi:hypothetical protein